jgi:hypothetical protein
MLGKLFGSDKVIEKGMDLIDDMWTSDSEREEDKRLMIEAKSKAKTDMMAAYAPFKLAQRWIAFGFTFVFLFIMVNGVLGAMYGIVDLPAVEEAKRFANEMWLGEIMIAIVSFYFGGGLAESIKRKGDSNASQ